MLPRVAGWRAVVVVVGCVGGVGVVRGVVEAAVGVVGTWCWGGGRVRGWVDGAGVVVGLRGVGGGGADVLFFLGGGLVGCFVR